MAAVTEVMVAAMAVDTAVMVVVMAAATVVIMEVMVATVVTETITQDMATIMTITMAIIRAIRATASQAEVITMITELGLAMAELIHGITGNIRLLCARFMVGIGQFFVWLLAPQWILLAISFQSLKTDTSVHLTRTELKTSKTLPWIVALMKALINIAAVSWIASQVTKNKKRKALREILALFADSRWRLN